MRIAYYSSRNVIEQAFITFFSILAARILKNPNKTLKRRRSERYFSMACTTRHLFAGIKRKKLVPFLKSQEEGRIEHVSRVLSVSQIFIYLDQVGVLFNRNL